MIAKSGLSTNQMIYIMKILQFYDNTVNNFEITKLRVNIIEPCTAPSCSIYTHLYWGSLNWKTRKSNESLTSRSTFCIRSCVTKIYLRRLYTGSKPYTWLMLFQAVLGQHSTHNYRMFTFWLQKGYSKSLKTGNYKSRKHHHRNTWRQDYVW